MSDPVRKFGDARLADRVVEAMAEGVSYRVLTFEECDQLGIPDGLCASLNLVAEPVRQNPLLSDAMAIVPGERDYLERKGFDKTFVDALAGPDGKRALRARVKWLADHVVTRWWRKDFNRNDRLAMVRDLESFWTDAQPALPALMELGLEAGLLQSAAISAVAAIANNRSAQFYHLGKMCGGGETGRDGLIAALEESEEEARCAVRALGKMREETAVPALIALAKREKGEELEWMAFEALGQMGKAAAPAIPLIIQRYYEQDNIPNIFAFFRQDIIKALAGIGQPTPEVLEFLGFLLQSRVDLRDLVPSLGKAAVPILVQSIGTDTAGSSDFHPMGPWIEQLGIRPENIRPLLVAIEKYKGDKYNFYNAISALGPEALKELTRLLDDPDLKVRKQAAIALGKMGQEAILALPLLESLRANPLEDKSLRNTAAKAIEEIVAGVL